MSAVLAVLGAAVLTASLVAGWAREQVLDEQRWTAQSVQVIRDPAVQQLLAEELAAAIVAIPAVQATVEGGPLPPPLAGAALSVLEQRAEETALRALQQASLDEPWAAANRAAHAQVRRWLEGDDLRRVDGELVLDARPALQQLARDLGLPAIAVAAAPSAQLAIADAARYDELRATVRGLQLAASWGLPAAVLLLAGAMLVARRRPLGLLAAGVATIAAGLAVLLGLRDEVRRALIDALADGGTPPAVSNAAWEAAAPALAARGWWALAAGAAISLAAAAWSRASRRA